MSRVSLGLSLLLLAIAGPLEAGFNSPVMVSSSGGPVGGFDLGLDFFENLTVAYEEGGEIIVATRTRDGTVAVSLGPGSEPSLAFDSVGALVAYSGEDPEGDGTRRILLRTRGASLWSAPAALSDADGEDRHPSLELWKTRTPAVAWERRHDDGRSEIRFLRRGHPPVSLGEGTRPVLLFDGAGRAHVLFLRTGDIYLAEEEASHRQGAFLPEVNVTATPALQETDLSAAIGANQAIHVAFAREGQVLLTGNEAGPFSPPAVVAATGAARPSMALSSTGALALVFEKDGDIHASLGTTFFLPQPVPAFESPQSDSRPRVLLDSFASRTVAFVRGSSLYYATDAGVPQAGFSADPLSGEAPLRVAFRDESVGPVTDWDWDFGDGTTSRDRNPVHVFELTGEYMVALRVTGPGGVSPVIQREVIQVNDPSNELHIGGVRVFPGQRNVHVPVLATHDRPIQGLTITATYDPQTIFVRAVEFEDTNIEGLRPELFAVKISSDPADPYVAAGILFDVALPIDGRELAPGSDYRVANIVIDVSREAVPGTVARIELRNKLGRPPLSNILTVEGQTVLPVLGPGGRIEISHLTFPPPRFFLRGDSNDDGTVNIADAVATLQHLFSGAEEPRCHDAADASDDGTLDISDPVFTLNFLFRSASYPPPPFPEPGLDPTDDGLPPCLLR